MQGSDIVALNIRLMDLDTGQIFYILFIFISPEKFKKISFSQSPQDLILNKQAVIGDSSDYCQVSNVLHKADDYRQ